MMVTTMMSLVERATACICCLLLHTIVTSSGFPIKSQRTVTFLPLLRGSIWDTFDRPSFELPQHVLLQRIDALLGETMEKELIFQQVDMDHARDAQACEILNQCADCPNISSEQFIPNNGTLGWISTGDRRRTLALQTTIEPIFNESSIALLRQVATQLWSTSNLQTSRFTYQRKGNFEAHLEDLCRLNDTLKHVLRQTLQQKIYPIVKQYFLEDNDFDMTPCVYDSLFIRYNATASESQLGAGQPLHRDLGLVSVNIMLNADFQGGGTLFEDQLAVPTAISPLKPVGPGHAIFHYSHLRHAGAGTMKGVRDILVLFLTATSPCGQAPARERAARIKTMASKVTGPLEKASLYRLVLDIVPDDGEAWHYLGTALHLFSDQLASASTLAAAALWEASKLNPNDARVFNNLGLVLERQSVLVDNDMAKVEQIYMKSLQLHQRSKQVGCDVVQDMNAAALNYGLFIANQDRFEEAIAILSQIGCPTMHDIDRVKDDAFKLREFCQRQVSNLAA
jgi:tetratricopeptide (TPR) repeat protein